MVSYSFPKASIQHRLGQLFLEYALFIVTLGIGYLVWFFIILGQGQTPGKQVLKLRVYDETTGAPAKWRQMFVREFGLFAALALIAYGLPIVMGVVSLSDFASSGLLPLGIGDAIYYSILLLDAFWIFRHESRKRLVDVLCKTDVLNEATK